jgi:hypothetical protein
MHVRDMRVPVLQTLVPMSVGVRLAGRIIGRMATGEKTEREACHKSSVTGRSDMSSEQSP